MIFDVDRFKSAITAIVREIMGDVRFFGAYGYRVQKSEAGKFSGSPESASLGLPDLQDVPIRCSANGGQSIVKLANGASVVIMFRNGDPSLPFLAHGSDDAHPKEAGFKATTKVVIDAPLTELGASPTGVATSQTQAAQLALEAAERTALQAFLGAAGVVAVSGGTAAPAAAASAAAAAGASLATNFSQTVRAGA